MKSLYTCCYKLSKHIPNDLPQIQISRKSPGSWKAGKKVVFRSLAPDDDVWALRGTGKGLGAYRRQIQRMFEEGELKSIVEALPEKGVMLCYELDHNECHRKVLADFLMEKGLATVKELFPEGHVERTILT